MILISNWGIRKLKFYPIISVKLGNLKILARRNLAKPHCASPSVLGGRHAGAEVEGVDGPVGNRREAGGPRPNPLEEHAVVRQVL